MFLLQIIPSLWSCLLLWMLSVHSVTLHGEHQSCHLSTTSDVDVSASAASSTAAAAAAIMVSRVFNLKIDSVMQLSAARRIETTKNPLKFVINQELIYTQFTIMINMWLSIYDFVRSVDCAELTFPLVSWSRDFLKLDVMTFSAFYWLWMLRKCGGSRSTTPSYDDCTINKKLCYRKETVRLLKSGSYTKAI